MSIWISNNGDLINEVCNTKLKSMNSFEAVNFDTGSKGVFFSLKTAKTWINKFNRVQKWKEIN